MRLSIHTFKQLQPWKNKRTGTMLGVLALFAVLGVILIRASSAATYTVGVEAESGSLSGNAASKTVASASGSAAVMFASSGAGGGGGTGAVSCDQAGIQKMVDSVSQQNIQASLQSLVQDDSKPTPNELISRHVSSPGNQIKVDWAKKQMTDYGLEVLNQPFSSGGRNLHNVSARINGTDANSLYVIGAHIDSISEKSSTQAPGADDDASGVIAVLEAARVLNGFKGCLKSTLYFNSYNDEEEEMNGAPTFLKAVSGKTVKGAYNMDMIGYAPSQECLKSDVGKSSRDQVMAQKIVDMNTKYNVGLPVTTGTYTQNGGDDLEAFWNANIPGGYLIECTTEKSTDGYPGYHSTKDVMKNVNLGQVTKTTKLLVASLAEFGMQ